MGKGGFVGRCRWVDCPSTTHFEESSPPPHRLRPSNPLPATSQKSRSSSANVSKLAVILRNDVFSRSPQEQAQEGAPEDAREAAQAQPPRVGQQDPHVAPAAARLGPGPAGEAGQGRGPVDRRRADASLNVPLILSMVDPRDGSRGSLFTAWVRDGACWEF